MKPATQVLIERYQKHLYAIAFNICRNQQDAEDVVQDTFIQYHTYKKEFDTEEHIRAWLIRVAVIKAKNITHKFNKDNICYVKLVDGDDSLYVTVKYNNGYASSPNKYISPREFN